jgi:predicted small secreted protein
VLFYKPGATPGAYLICAGVVYVHKEGGMKKFTLFCLLVVISVASVLAGCNLFRGAGKDISDTGKHLQNVGK